MGHNMRLLLEMAEETKRLTMEGLEFQAALRQTKEMYKEQLKEKTHNSTDQSKSYELDTKTTETIIPPGTDLDNNEIYDIKTGQTIGELE